MTHPSDIAGLSERLRAQVTSDHARGCEGRNYSCDCGYDLSTEGLLELAAAALDSLSARVKELEDHNRRLGQGSAERYWEDRYRDEAAALARAEQQRDEFKRVALSRLDDLTKAEAILKTFAIAAESLNDSHLDRMDLWGSASAMEITAGHLRAARDLVRRSAALAVDGPSNLRHFVLSHWDNQDMSHVDFRVHAYQIAAASDGEVG